jgi:hypothetical protein
LWAKEIADGRLAFQDEFLTAALFIGNGLTGVVDLLVIGIDGNDYHMWQTIDAVALRVVTLNSMRSSLPD